MNILIKLFILLYLLAMVLVTILSVVWILSAIFSPRLPSRKAMLMKVHRHKST